MITDPAERQERKPRSAFRSPSVSATSAFFLYLALTIAMTWPLAIGVTRDIPGDFGDPLFTSWVLAWDATHLGRGWWSANIFAPHPLTLAYSEHFLPQALQVLPIYAVTKNPILCYNLLFVSTFALSGLGMFLLGRELTGSAAAGLVSGLAFAFAPYRLANVPHLQVLSAQWMPFVLFGLHRHFATGRVQALAGGAAAWLVQNLSCGYYLLFFTPVVVMYVVWEISRRGLWRDAAALTRIGLAVAIVFAATAPFLLPYLELRRLGFAPRSVTEVRRFSADVYSYFTADPNLRLWGPIAQAWPRAEGLLFPGLTIAILAALGVAGAGARFAPSGDGCARPLVDRGSADRGQRVHRLSFLVLLAAVAVVATLLLGFSIRLPGIKITSLPRAVLLTTIVAALLLAVSHDWRARARRWLHAPAGIFSIIVVFAGLMSFGPDIHAQGRLVARTNVYALFMELAPGFDGVRVPARYAMVVTLGLSALAALGIASIDDRRRGYVSIAAAGLILIESLAVPLPINQTGARYSQNDLAPLSPSVGTGALLPEVYRFATQLPASAVLLELPVGEPAFDIRYMFYSTTHWRRLVNGYSGGAPEDYGLLTEAFKDAETRPDRAWEAIATSAATHVIVHEGAYVNGAGVRLSAWLRSRGAREIAALGSDRVFALPSR